MVFRVEDKPSGLEIGTFRWSMTEGSQGSEYTPNQANLAKLKGKIARLRVPPANQRVALDRAAITLFRNMMLLQAARQAATVSFGGGGLAGGGTSFKPWPSLPASWSANCPMRRSARCGATLHAGQWLVSFRQGVPTERGGVARRLRGGRRCGYRAAGVVPGARRRTAIWPLKSIGRTSNGDDSPASSRSTAPRSD